MISLAYLKPKGLFAYVGFSGAVGVIIMILLFTTAKPDLAETEIKPLFNLLGKAYSSTHNLIFFIAAVALCTILCWFCNSYAKMLKSLVEAEHKAALAAKAKGNFLAKMSHEIRTPLNAVIGLTETRLRKELSPDDRETMGKIQSSGNLLLGIINDILDLSKIESGKFDLIQEEYAVADIMNDIVNMNAVRIGVKPIRFLVEIDESVPARLTGDSLRIKQLLSNLLSNAFKYTEAGTVALSLTWLSESGRARLIFKVSDTGAGLRPEDLDKLFAEYSQVDRQANKDKEGTGLGLSICKWLTELMGGRIYASSEYGKGSVFTAEIIQDVFDLTPLGAKNAAALKDFTYIPENRAATAEYTPMPYGKVLIVDDVEINLIVAAALMEPYEMQVDCLDNGAGAVERIKNGEIKYDVIFMDHMMPDMDGIETLNSIRALGTDYAKSVPVVALTANAIAGNEKMFVESGFQDFLSKPIEPPKLDDVLRKWVMKS